MDNNGNVLGRYIQVGIDEPLGEVRSGTTSFYQQDGVGSTTSLSSAAGVLANTYVYDSFGKLINSSGTVANPFQFAGREFDPEISMYENRTRYYEPNRGRFSSEDPIGFAGDDNFYVYVKNSPTNYVDPVGLSGWRAGGPYKLPPGVKTKCREGDSCEQIRAKMWALERMFSSRIGWDTIMPFPRGGNHGDAINAIAIQWAECKDLYDKYCSTCKKNPQSSPIQNPSQSDEWWQNFNDAFWDGVRETMWEIETGLSHAGQGQQGGSTLGPPFISNPGYAMP